MTADSAHVHASLLPIAVAMILYSQVGKVGSHVFVRVHVVLSPIKFAIGYLGGILFFPCSLAGGISLYTFSPALLLQSSSSCSGGRCGVQRELCGAAYGTRKTFSPYGLVQYTLIPRHARSTRLSWPRPWRYILP